MTSLLLIANADAGSSDDAAVDAVVSAMQDGADIELVRTASPDELSAALKEHPDVDGVVVLGGDGSLHAVVKAVREAGRLGDVTIGLVPLGTGNDFARGVDIPLDPADAAAVIMAGATRRIDLIVDDAGLVVVNNVHLGVGAQASREAKAWKSRLGRFGYVVGAIKAAAKPDFIRVQVVVDGEPLLRRQRVVQVAIGNGSTVGGGTELIPDADPTDGELTVIVSHAVRALSRLVYMARLKGASHHLMKEVVRVSGRRVEVEGDDFWVTADGEL
ncbi:MAG: diacylglycerol kinase family protein, partial [Aeromicrobium sp.]